MFYQGDGIFGGFMTRKISAREANIRKHFGLAPSAEIFFSRKVVVGPNGEKLHGWFCNENGKTRHLGNSAIASVLSPMAQKTVLPPPKLV
jgi:hypothetical protein